MPPTSTAHQELLSPAGEGVTVEVCIVAYRSEDCIAQAVRSSKLIPGSSVAVCDNGPGSSSLEPARRAADSAGLTFRNLTAAHNPGFSASCNALARSSSAHWLVFLNPDAIIIEWPWGASGPSPGVLLGAVQRTSAGKELGAYGRSYGVLEEMRRSWLRGKSPAPHGRGFVGGGALAIERHRFGELGGFDERYFMFYEDIDLCLRAYTSGMTVVMEPRWSVIHDLGHSARKNIGNALLVSYESGRMFHTTPRDHTRAYDMYVATDSALRWVFSAVKRRRAHRHAYASLLRVAIGNLLGATGRRAT